MNLKEKLLKLVPSYRCKNVIIDELNNMNHNLNQKMIQMQKQISDLNNKNDYLFFCLQHTAGENDLETRKKAFLNMPQAEGDLRLIQLISNHILVRLKEVCDRNSLKFFLMAGTLVGALRHEGYIPWDDDIDIGMMRPDYERLVDALKDDDYLDVATYYSIHGNRQIKVKLKQSDDFFVDIYVFDYIDVNEQNKQSRWEETQRISRQIEGVIRKMLPPKENVKEITRPLQFEDIEEAVIQSTKEMYEKYEYLGKGSYFCPVIDMPSSFRKNHTPLKVEDHFPFEEYLFEGHKYDVWKNYMGYFEHIYNPWDLPNSVKPHLLSEYGTDVKKRINDLLNEGIEL